MLLNIMLGSFVQTKFFQFTIKHPFPVESPSKLPSYILATPKTPRNPGLPPLSADVGHQRRGGRVANKGLENVCSNNRRKKCPMKEIYGCR